MFCIFLHSEFFVKSVPFRNCAFFISINIYKYAFLEWFTKHFRFPQTFNQPLAVDELGLVVAEMLEWRFLTSFLILNFLPRHFGSNQGSKFLARNVYINQSEYSTISFDTWVCLVIGQFKWREPRILNPYFCSWPVLSKYYMCSLITTPCIWITQWAFRRYLKFIVLYVNNAIYH